MDGVTWDSSYPDPARLRREVDAMIAAYVDTLLDATPQGKIVGIYLKGSARKTWDTPLDYVPEVSDVDIHIMLETEAAASYLMPIDRAVEIAAAAMRRYREAITDPLHVPRPQLLIANFLYSQPDYVPSPGGTVETVYGKPLEEPAPGAKDTREIVRRQLTEQEEYLGELGELAIDKPGKYLAVALRTMSWRVSPTAPRVLELLGLPFDVAWSSNRTALVRHLHAVGEVLLAIDYAAFYLHAWEYFLSGLQAERAGSEAVLAGARVLTRGVAIAEGS